MPNGPLLKIEALAVGYEESTVLEDISLTVYAGDMICLMGANGSGKSTLLRTICGLNKKKSGNVFIENKEIEMLQNSELSKLISIVLTERSNINGLSVEDIVRLGRFPYTNVWGKLQEHDRQIINQSIELLNLEDIRTSLAEELSDGQLQKVFIARALVQDTPIIILDEPTSYLDVSSKLELMSVLERISTEKNKALIFSSHDWDLVLEMCSKVWLIENKSLISSGAPEELLLSGKIQKIFKHESFYLNNSNGRFCELREMKKSLNFICEDAIVREWTIHALNKIGYEVTELSELKLHYKNKNFEFEGTGYNKLSDLLDYLKLN